MIHFNVFSTALPVKAILPCLVLLTIFASATVGADTSSAGCALYAFGSNLPSGHHVTDAEINGSCGAADNPCIAGKKGITWGHAECGKCYKITYSRDDVHDHTYCNKICHSDDARDCKSLCKGYTREVHIKVLDGSYSEDDFSIDQGGFEHLCPHLCHSSTICVTNEAECRYGVYPAVNGIPGFCYTTIPVTVEEAVCGSRVDDEEEKPTETDEKPTEAADEKPTETDEKPTEAADEKPTETDEKPTEAEKPTEETDDGNQNESADKHASGADWRGSAIGTLFASLTLPLVLSWLA